MKASATQNLPPNLSGNIPISSLSGKYKACLPVALQAPPRWVTGATVQQARDFLCHHFIGGKTSVQLRTNCGNLPGWYP
jgi:hypothetical protein